MGLSYCLWRKDLQEPACFTEGPGNQRAVTQYTRAEAFAELVEHQSDRLAAGMGRDEWIVVLPMNDEEVVAWTSTATT